MQLVTAVIILLEFRLLETSNATSNRIVELDLLFFVVCVCVAEVVVVFINIVAMVIRAGYH